MPSRTTTYSHLRPIIQRQSGLVEAFRLRVTVRETQGEIYFDAFIDLVMTVPSPLKPLDQWSDSEIRAFVERTVATDEPAKKELAGLHRLLDQRLRVIEDPPLLPLTWTTP